MSVSVQTSVNLRELDALADKWGKLAVSLARDSGAAKRAAERAALLVVAATQEEIYSRSTSGGPASVRTGALARSFRAVARVTKRSMQIAAVSEISYARIQDRGGIIRPRAAKSLAIPLIPMAVGKWPRHWPKGELFRPYGTKVLARKKGRSGFEPIYALAKSVRIPAKKYSEAALKKASPKVAKLLIDELITGLKR